MEPTRNTESSFDKRTSPSTNSDDEEQFNKGKTQVSLSPPFSPELKSQDQYDFMSNATTTKTHPNSIDSTSPSSIHNSGSSVDRKNSPSTNSREVQHFNKGNIQVPSSSPFSLELKSQDHFDFVPIAATTKINTRPIDATSPSSIHSSRFSVERTTNPSTNSGEGEQFNKGKTQVLSSSPFSSELKSQDHFDLVPNATTIKTNHNSVDAISPSCICNSGSSVDRRSNPSTNLGEGEQFSKEKTQVPSSSPFSLELNSQDHFDFVPTTTTNKINPILIDATSPSSIHNSGSSVERRNSLSTNSSEGKQLNKEKKQISSSSPFSPELQSQNHFDFISNTTTTKTNPKPRDATSPPRDDQTYFHKELDKTYSEERKGDREPANSNLKEHNDNPFGEAHPSPLENNTSPSSSSQNPFLVMYDATNSKHVGASESEKVNDHQYSVPAKQKEKGGITNSSVTAFPADGMLGPHSSLAPSTNESSQRNPFKEPTSATSKDTQVSAADSVEVDGYHNHGYESHHTHPSPGHGHLSMPISEARTHNTNTHGETSVLYSSQQLDPYFTLESTKNEQKADANSKNHAGATNTPISVEPHHTFSVTEQGHHRKISSNSGIDKKLCSPMSSFSPASEFSTQDHMRNSPNAATKPPQKRGKDVKFASEFTDDDIPISSSPNHGHQTSDDAGQYSSSAVVPGTSNGSEKQSPPLQVMQRPENPTTSSNYRFPSHVFDRHKSKSNTQWSTASNESLFSIPMGNTSFSSDMAWMSKSGEMDKTGDMNSSGVIPSNQPPLPLPPQSQPQSQSQSQSQSQPQSKSQSQPQVPSTKFKDISQSTAKHYEGSRNTEEKAAETMREVIMESSITRDNINKGDLTTAGSAISSIEHSTSNAHSRHSDGSTKSFAFNVMTDGDKTLSPKDGEEKRKQQKQPEQQTPKATPSEAVQKPKSTTNASQNNNKSWLSCFSCC